MTTNSPSEKRLEELREQAWKDGWEQLVTTMVMTTPVVVFAGLGTAAAVLVETTRRANRALRSSEIEFRAAFEDAPVGMAITGLHGDEARRFLPHHSAFTNSP